MRRWLRRLHDDRRGQVVPLFMLGLLTLVVSVAMVINTGRMVHNRTRAQNAADAAALTQASWAARSMNVISMNNVGLVHMFTTFMISNAFSKTSLEAGKVAGQKAREAQNAFNSCKGVIGGIPIVGEACDVYEAYAAAMAAIVAQLTAIEARYAVTTNGVTTSLRLIGAFNAMSDHIVNEFPAFTWTIADRMRAQNGVDQVLFYPMSPKGQNDPKYRGTSIPVAGGYPGIGGWGPMVEICKVAEEGPGKGLLLGDVRVNLAKHGYTRRAGPYVRSKEDPGWILTSSRLTDLLPLPTDLSFPTVPGPLMLLWNEQGTVPPTPPVIAPPPLLWFDSNPDWKTTAIPWFYVPSIPVPPFLLPPYGFLGAYNQVEQPPYGGVLGVKKWNNSYARTMEDDWKKTCRLGGEFSLPALLSRPKVFMLTHPTQFVQLVTPGQGSQKYFMRDPLALMAFTSRQEAPLAVPDRFENPPGGVYAFSQANVFNIVSYDLYTQAWGARLEPARWMEDGGKLQQIRTALGRESAFRPLRTLLSRMSPSDVVKVHAH